MSAADLNGHAWQIVLAVVLLCVAGVALGFSLSPQVKARVGIVITIPLQLLSFLLGAAATYDFLVRDRHWGDWGLALWAGFIALGLLAAVRDMMKTVTGGQTGGETRP